MQIVDQGKVLRYTRSGGEVSWWGVGLGLLEVFLEVIAGQLHVVGLFGVLACKF